MCRVHRSSSLSGGEYRTGFLENGAVSAWLIRERFSFIGSLIRRPLNGTSVSVRGPEPPIVGPRRYLISVALRRRDSRKFRVGLLHVFCVNQAQMPCYRNDERLSIH